MRFDSKISAIEERTDMATMIVNELHGTLTTYEMRTEQEDTSRKEATFKVSNQRRTSKPKPKPKDSNNDEFDSKEEANFLRKLKRGIGKYKGKLPLICFECGKIGHFASKCPYAKIIIVMMKIAIRKKIVLRSIRKQTMEGLPRA